jgi:hypothetical protein
MDASVRRVADGTPSRNHRGLLWGDGEDSFWGRRNLYPADGYEWASGDPNDLAVTFVIDGSPSSEDERLLWDGNGNRYPRAGFQWISKAKGDFRLYGEETTQVGVYYFINVLNNISRMPIFNNQRTGAVHSSLPKGTPEYERLVSNNCQTFFRAFGEKIAELGASPAWKEAFPLKKLGKPQADGIAKAIEEDKKNWKELDSWWDAQLEANKGHIVIGAMKAGGDRKHGHLAIVFPMASEFQTETGGLSFLQGDGPLIRDGNEHLYTDPTTGRQRAFPSTWGAIRASLAMPLNETKWFVYGTYD